VKWVQGRWLIYNANDSVPTGEFGFFGLKKKQ
jgi:hypothetical protein